MNLKREIAQTRSRIGDIQLKLKFVAWRMGVLRTNTFLLQRKILTLGERDALLGEYESLLTEAHIEIKQLRRLLELKVTALKLIRNPPPDDEDEGT